MRYSAIAFCMMIAGMETQNSTTDFKQVMTVYSAEQGDSAVLAVFRSLGLDIKKNTLLMIEAEESGSGGIGGGKVRRILRATISAGDSTGIFLVGEEVRYDVNGWAVRRKRVTDRDGGGNGKFWQKVVTAARLIDSAAAKGAASAQRRSSP
jgi:hypothetical protein